MSLEFNPESIEGVVHITNDHLYVKSPKALSVLQDYLDSLGYDVKDVSSENHFSAKPPRKVQEQDGWCLWFGRLNDSILQYKAECRLCESIFDKVKLAKPEYTCESCEARIHEEYPAGSEISFIPRDDREVSMKNLTFIIHSFDKEKERLNLYVTPSDCLERRSRRTHNFNYTPEECESMVPDLVRKFPKTFSLKEINGKKILSVFFKGDHYVHEHSINITDIGDKVTNYANVTIFHGKKFPEWKSLPIPEHVSIYEAWHWAPLRPGPNVYKRIMSAAGQVSRKDFYYQDGRTAFYDRQLEWMFKFIDQLTTINLETIKPFLLRDLSGPGFIDNLAKLTGHTGFIPTEPNVGNSLVFFGKILNGQPVNQKEVDEAIKGAGLDDPDNMLGKILGDDLIKKVFEAVAGPTPFNETRQKGNKNRF